MFRFVFILDKCDLDFNITNKLYAKQLRKHLFVNIYKDGRWGTIARNIVDISNSIVPIHSIDNNIDNNINRQVNSAVYVK